MPEIEVPCPTCAATGNMTPGGGRNNLKDRCTTCGGQRTIPARPGESRETSWPFAVPGAPQPPSYTPGEAERLVDALIAVAQDGAWTNHDGAASWGRDKYDAVYAKIVAARTALLSHISTAGRASSPDRVIKERGEDGRRPDGPGLSLRALHAANIARQAEWCPDQVPDLSFRGNELAGEAGEACNIVKKLERERHGWRGSRATLDDLAQELADVVICADLCAVTAGIDLDAAVVAKFNATSEKQGLSTMLPRPEAASPVTEGEAPDQISTLKAEPTEQTIARLTRERDEAEADRDALLAAIGFKPGPLGTELRRKVILDDAGGLRGAMVKARREAADVQCDADLWTMRMLEEWPGDTLLLRLWRQRREAVKRAKAAEAALAESERKRGERPGACPEVAMANAGRAEAQAAHLRSLDRLAALGDDLHRAKTQAVQLVDLQRAGERCGLTLGQADILWSGALEARTARLATPTQETPHVES